MIRECDGSGIKNDNVLLLDGSNQLCGISNLLTNVDGRYTTYSCVFPSYSGDLAILPDKNYKKNVKNGVTVIDIYLINQHILGNLPFQDPFQLIASDVNKSASVTTFDLALIRKVILGIEGTFPAGSWRYIPDLCFVDTDFATEFSDDDDPNQSGVQLNPFNAIWTDPQNNIRQYIGSAMPNNDSWMDHLILEPNEAYADNPETWSFHGVKVGDVDCNAGLSTSQSDFMVEDAFFVASHAQIATNDTFYLVVWADSTIGNTLVTGWQMGIEVDPSVLEILSVQSPDFYGFNSESFHYSEEGGLGKLRALWFDSLSVEPSISDRNLLLIQARALQTISDIGQYFQLRDSILSTYLYDDQINTVEDIPLRLAVSYNPTSPRSAHGISAENLNDISVRPVPFKNELVFQFQAAEPGQANLLVFNSLGSIVASTIFSCSQGDNIARLTGLDNLPCGFYYYSLNSGTSMAGRQLLKL